MTIKGVKKDSKLTPIFIWSSFLLMVMTVWLIPVHPVRADMVVDWTFNQSSGKVAMDSGPNSINGTLTGTTASWSTGMGQNAVNLTGDGFVNFTQPGFPKVPDVISQLSQGSIAVEFYVSSYPSYNTILPIFWMGRGLGGPNQYGLTIEIGHGPPYTPTYNHNLYFTIMDGSVPVQCFNTVQEIQAGQWYTFVGVVSSTGNTGYLNGQELYDRHYNFGDPNTTDFFSSVTNPSNALWVGKGFLGDTFTPMYFNGLIQNVQIYNTPLTGDQIKDLYSVPEPSSFVLGILALAAMTGWLKLGNANIRLFSVAIK